MLERAAELDRRALSEEALQVLEGCGDWPVPYNERALLLRAKVLMVTRGPIAALDELPEDAEAFTTQECRVGYFLASAQAYIGTRNWRAAEKNLLAAQTALSGPTDRQRFTLAYLRARVRWALREYNADDPDLALAVGSADDSWRFHAVNLRSWMRGGVEDYRGQLSDLLQCLALYRRHADRIDVRSIAITLRAALGFSWELADFDACADAVQLFDSLPWVPQVAFQRFFCLHQLSWLTFLHGDPAAADEYVRKELLESSSPALKTFAHTDQAYFAGLCGNRALEAEALRSARASADVVDWKYTRDDEHEALLALSALLAREHPEDARRYLRMHESLYPHGRNENVEGSHHTRRSQAWANYVEGRIQQGLGSLRISAQLLESSYDLFARLEFEWRSLLVAQALFEVTHEERWLEAARRHAGSYPNTAVSRHFSV